MSGTIEVTSVGQAGIPDFNRSEGRAYLTANHVYQTSEELLQEFRQLQRTALQLETGGRRRTVLRARCSGEVAQEIMHREDVPLEVVVPLSLINPENSDYLVLLAENVHDSPIPEWSLVYNYWQTPRSCRSPLARVLSLPDGFSLTSELRESDAVNLSRIWWAFGWTPEGVRQFIEAYSEADSLWFSGVRMHDTGELVSACMGEQLDFAGIRMVEGTEYGTLPNYEGSGLCTAAVSALHAQILRDTYYQDREFPLITAEFDMASRSDIVGRNAGMTIPLVEGVDGLQNFPIQVLRYNVSVLDRHNPNSLNWRELGENRYHFRNSFRTTYRYWRNFILGVLPHSITQDAYSSVQVQKILGCVEGR